MDEELVIAPLEPELEPDVASAEFEPLEVALPEFEEDP